MHCVHAILIQKGQQQVLIDGGPDPERISLELGERLPFWDRTIELVILTHPEADHVTGLVEVLRRYGVGQVVTSGQVSETSVYAEWDRLIDEKGVKRSVARAGQTITLADGMVLEVLHPRLDPHQSTSSDVNNNSVVARLVFSDFSLLLTGDIFEAVERDLLENRPGVQSTALKVAHHGSDTSSCEEFLAGVDPQVAVVSAGADNPFGTARPCRLSTSFCQTPFCPIPPWTSHGIINPDGLSWPCLLLAVRGATVVAVAGGKNVG